MPSIISISKDDFQAEVLEANLPVLIDFWAAWCGPCRMFSPVVEAIAESYADKFKVVKVNVDEQPELAEQFEVMSIPTLALIKDGETMDSLTGALPRQLVEQWLTQQEII